MCKFLVDAALAKASASPLSPSASWAKKELMIFYGTLLCLNLIAAFYEALMSCLFFGNRNIIGVLSCLLFSNFGRQSFGIGTEA